MDITSEQSLADETKQLYKQVVTCFREDRRNDAEKPFERLCDLLRSKSEEEHLNALARGEYYCYKLASVHAIAA